MRRTWSPQKAKEHRQASGLSQADVAAAVGVRVSTVSEWENGRRSPTTASLVALADAYGVSLDEFVVHAPEVAKTCNGASQKITHGASTAKPDPVGNATGA